MDARVGFHVSIAGAISNSVDNAKKISCTAFQIFSRNPRGWAAKPLSPDDVQNFKNKLTKSGIKKDSVLVHMPYLPNLSGPDGDLYSKSVETLAGEIQRCSALGIPYLVIHLGSHQGKGTESGINQLVKACNMAFKKAKSDAVTVLLENNTGWKNSVGGKFEEIRLMLDKLDSKKFGVCLDTCHTFVSGYDLRTEEDVERTLERFDDIVGLKELKFVHLNDSKGVINSNLDRHEHIGLGNIGLKGFAALLRHKSILKVPIIMETPIDDRRGDLENLQLVQKLIKS